MSTPNTVSTPNTLSTLTKVLVANRGEIAVRVLRTCRALGLPTVAVYSEVDAGLPHVALADEAVCIGPAPATESYLNAAAILAAAARTGADAIHPGYGFLSENAPFAEAVEAAGLTFIGPRPDAMRAMGDKAAARQLMAARGVPVVPGYDGEDQADARFAQEAARVGYPVLVKAAAGGGGKGMTVVAEPAALPDALARARRLALAAFKDDRLLLEKYLEGPRHVEVQILGDGRGRVLHVFERECSIQRRFQKIIEETPSPALDDEKRAALCAAGVAAGEALAYRGAGTVEFILDAHGAFYFLEVNTRLQVEHPITELITGLDLVAWQIRVARGEALPPQASITARGHAVECRLYAEDPARDFLPSTGRLVIFELPQGPHLRMDAGVAEGCDVSVYYDPLLAKLVAWGETRDEALDRMAGALLRTRVAGVTTNRDLLHAVVRHPAFRAGLTTTAFLDQHLPAFQAASDPAAVLRRAVVLVLHRACRRRLDQGLPTLRGGWRNNPFRGQREVLLDGETSFQIEYFDRGGHFEARHGTEHFVVRGVHPGTVFSAEVGGHRTTYRIALHGEYAYVADGLGISRFARQARFPAGIEAEAAGSLAAPMPGRVVQVPVAVGDQVAKGQVLVVLEAMKMEQSLLAPHAGQVVAVDCAVGQVVEAGAVLVVLEGG